MPPITPDAGLANTRWSLVAAVASGSSDEARRSLAELGRGYWYPVYAYLRRCGHPAEIADDIAMAFFAELVTAIRRERGGFGGRFRDFLLARLNAFLLTDWRAAANEPGAVPLTAPYPLALLEQRFARDRDDGASPESAFHRGYAMEILQRCLGRLRIEAHQGGRDGLFERLLPYLSADPPAGTYDALAAEFNARPLALVIAVKRLRQRYRELVDQELADTVSSAADLEREREALLAALAGPVPR